MTGSNMRDAATNGGRRRLLVAVALSVVAVTALCGAGVAVLRWRNAQTRTDAERARLAADLAPQESKLDEIRREVESLDRRRVLLILDAKPEARASLAAVEADLLGRVCETSPDASATDAVTTATATSDSEHPELAAATPEWRAGLDMQAVRGALEHCGGNH